MYTLLWVAVHTHSMSAVKRQLSVPNVLVTAHKQRRQQQPSNNNNNKLGEDNIQQQQWGGTWTYDKDVTVI